MTTSLKNLHNRWHRALAKHWSANPITYCEVRFENCMGTFGLAPAHSKKRRFIKTEQDYTEVVASCQSCHRDLDERMTHEEMERTVKEIIAKRCHQPG